MFESTYTLKVKYSASKESSVKLISMKPSLTWPQVRVAASICNTGIVTVIPKSLSGAVGSEQVRHHTKRSKWQEPFKMGPKLMVRVGESIT